MAWAPDYLTLEEVKAFERIEDDDTVSDAELALWISAGSRAIDHATGRQFGVLDAPAPFSYTSRDIYLDACRDVWVLDVDDLMDVDGLAVVADGENATAAAFEERNAVAKGQPYERLIFAGDAFLYVPRVIEVTALWGWTAVPAAVQGALKLQVSRWAARQDSPYGVAGSPEAGNELRLLDRLDPDVAVMLKSVTRLERAR